MSLTTEQEQLISSLEEVYLRLQKTQTNLKKCPKQRLTRGYIETKMNCIGEYWQMFKSSHEQLVKGTAKCNRNEIPYFLNDDYFLMEDLYMCLHGDLKDMLLSNFNTNINTCNQGQQIEPPAVKLPRICLPSFDGSYDAWANYRDLFLSLVHNNKSLTKVQKLHYLKSSIVGEPEVLLKHIHITEINYEQAWNILTQRYGNKRLIVNSILQRLFNQKKINTPSAGQLKSLLDTTCQCINNLKNQDLSTDTWDQLIIYIVVQRLDVDTHKAWEEYTFNKDANHLPTWADLKTFLETKFRTLEMLDPAKLNMTYVKAKSFYATSVNENPETTPTISCSMCSADHALCHCKDFGKMNPIDRSEFIKKNRLCFNCMMAGHTVVRCRNRMSCRKCNRRHHTLLHSDGKSNEEEERNTERENEPENVLSTYFASEGSTALLATALVMVKDENGQSKALRALIDQGSQANFLTERAAQLLKIKRSSIKGKISGIGTTETEVSHMVQIKLKSRCDKDFELTVNAYVMPTQLTSHLPSKTVACTPHTWPHLQGCDLADPSFNTPGQIDMLLGVEVYAQIMKAEILKGPPGSPCAQNTSLGWILFGGIPAAMTQRIHVMHHQLKLHDVLNVTWKTDTDTKGEERSIQGKWEDNKNKENSKNKNNMENMIDIRSRPNSDASNILYSHYYNRSDELGPEIEIECFEKCECSKKRRSTCTGDMTL